MSRRRPRHEGWSSDEAGSSNSGSSVDTLVDGNGRRGHPATRDFSRYSSQREDSKIRGSLQRKLLSNNGARLSRIERRLLRADRSREGTVSVATFKAALAAASKSDGAEIRRHEMLWLTRRLAGRNGRNVAILKMRRLLEDNDREGARRPASEGVGQGKRNYRRRSEIRLRRGVSTDESSSDGRAGSESGRSSRGGAMKWRSSPPPPARWAIRQGTVGQWLHEVAAPLERKLFFEFLRDLEKFESRNGLDHYRVRPSLTPGRRRSLDDDDDDDDDGVGSRHCGEDGTTVVHLGPMLKAAIKFYV